MRVCAAVRGTDPNGRRSTARRGSPARVTIRQVADRLLALADRLAAGSRRSASRERGEPMSDPQLDQNLPGVPRDPRTRRRLRGAQARRVRDRARRRPRELQEVPAVDDSVTYPKVGHDLRGEIGSTPSVDLPDYSGPFKADLRFSDFSRDQLVRMLSMSYEYYVLLVEAWAAEVALAQGRRRDAGAPDGRVDRRRAPARAAHLRGVVGVRRGRRDAGARRRRRHRSARSSPIRGTRSATRSGSSSCSSGATSSSCS